MYKTEKKQKGTARGRENHRSSRMTTSKKPTVRLGNITSAVALVTIMGNEKRTAPFHVDRATTRAVALGCSSYRTGTHTHTQNEKRTYHTQQEGSEVLLIERDEYSHVERRGEWR